MQYNLTTMALSRREAIFFIAIGLSMLTLATITFIVACIGSNTAVGINIGFNGLYVCIKYLIKVIFDSYLHETVPRCSYVRRMHNMYLQLCHTWEYLLTTVVFVRSAVPKFLTWTPPVKLPLALVLSSSMSSLVISQ